MDASKFADSDLRNQYQNVVKIQGVIDNVAPRCLSNFSSGGIPGTFIFVEGNSGKLISSECTAPDYRCT
jgi:hypothetical protein